jgi:hypothetical protein
MSIENGYGERRTVTVSCSSMSEAKTSMRAAALAESECCKGSAAAGLHRPI